MMGNTRLYWKEGENIHILNCEICTLLLDDILMIDGQIADVRLDELREHIKMLHEKVITFNNVA